MPLRLISALVLIIAFATISSAQVKKTRRVVNGEALISALVTSKNLPARFGDDGVFVNTLLEGRDQVPPEVRRILNQGAKAIPLLIAHLDDTRLTRMSFCCTGDSGEVQVTVGDAALDILRRIVVNSAPMFDAQCVKDRAAGGEPGESSCLDARFEFSPPSFSRRGKLRRASKEVLVAKRNWQRAYTNKKIRYSKYED